MGLLIGVLCAAPARPASAAQPSTQDSQTVAEAGDSPKISLSPNVYPPGVVNEDEYIAWLKTEDERLTRQELQNGSAPDAGAVAYHANWILAVQCEPHVSRILLGLNDLKDVSAVVALCDRAAERLRKAADGWGDRDGRDLLDFLLTLTQAVSSYHQSRLNQADPKRLEVLAGELAIWLDEDDPQIARTALLWQSLLYTQINQPDRALAALPLPLSPIQGSTTEFFNRLVRCNILINQGCTALAEALLLKMEEKCSHWFKDESQEESALCALDWTRFRISPPESLDDLTEKIRAGRVERIRKNLVREDGQPCQAIRLEQIAPMLIKAPEAPDGMGKAASMPTVPTMETQPVSQPSTAGETDETQDE